ncbi:MAG: hypothetical protein H7844_14375 [Nitrospirae bacterium YQR-1]
MHILAVIGAFFARWLAVDALKFFAFKTVLYVVIIYLLPKALYNLISRIYSETFQMISGSVSFSDTTLNFTGLSGWFMDTLRVPECFTIILTAYIARFLITLVPFGPK